MEAHLSGRLCGVVASSGTGLHTEGLGFRVEGLGFRVWGVRVSVSGAWALIKGVRLASGFGLG